MLLAKGFKEATIKAGRKPRWDLKLQLMAPARQVRKGLAHKASLIISPCHSICLFQASSYRALETLARIRIDNRILKSWDITISRKEDTIR